MFTLQNLGLAAPAPPQIKTRSASNQDLDDFSSTLLFSLVKNIDFMEKQMDEAGEDEQEEGNHGAAEDHVQIAMEYEFEVQPLDEGTVIPRDLSDDDLV